MYPVKDNSKIIFFNCQLKTDKWKIFEEGTGNTDHAVDSA
jgi:hypothetical protein